MIFYEKRTISLRKVILFNIYRLFGFLIEYDNDTIILVYCKLKYGLIDISQSMQFGFPSLFVFHYESDVYFENCDIIFSKTKIVVFSKTFQ